MVDDTSNSGNINVYQLNEANKNQILDTNKLLTFIPELSATC